MNGQLIAIQCLMMSFYAQVEGMKAENLERERNGYALAYDDTAFCNIARELDKLAVEARSL